MKDDLTPRGQALRSIGNIACVLAVVIAVVGLWIFVASLGHDGVVHNVNGTVSFEEPSMGALVAGAVGFMVLFPIGVFFRARSEVS